MSYELVNIGKLCSKIGSGSTPRGGNKSYKDEGITLIRSMNVHNGYFKPDNLAFIDENQAKKLSNVTIEKDDVLLNITGASVARCCVVDCKYIPARVNQHVMILRANKELLNNSYLNKYLISSKVQSMLTRISGSGATREAITKGQVEKFLIPLPPLETQKKIVDILDKAQSLIDQRKEQIKEMDSLIQSLFYDMFGDPVTNPMGWKKGRIKDLTLKTQYGTSKKADELLGEFPILRMNNITYNGNWDFKRLKYIDLDEKEISKYMVHKGELLFNRTNSKELVGKTAVYRNDKSMAYAGYLVKLITNEEGNSVYISAYLNSKHGKAVLLNMAKNIVGMANINAEELKNIKIHLPPIELQNTFADRVKHIEQQKECMTSSLKELEDNFNCLMQKAFKGELV